MLSYFPRAKKVQAGQPTEDLSLHTLIALTAGPLLRVVFRAFRSDWIIVAANLIGTGLAGSVLYRKMREQRCAGRG